MKKISGKQVYLSSKLTLNSTKCLQTVQNQKVWHKGRAMENQNKIFLANSDPISVNFSKGQVNWTTSLSDLDSELDIVYKLNWPAQKTTEKTTYCKWTALSVFYLPWFFFKYSFLSKLSKSWLISFHCFILLSYGSKCILAIWSPTLDKFSHSPLKYFIFPWFLCVLAAKKPDPAYSKAVHNISWIKHFATFFFLDYCWLINDKIDWPQPLDGLLARSCRIPSLHHQKFLQPPQLSWQYFSETEDRYIYLWGEINLLNNYHLMIT